MFPHRKTLFESANLRVVAHEFGTPTLAVTFWAFRLNPTKEDEGFAEGFFYSRQMDCVCVICEGNCWFQYPETGLAIKAIAEHVARYQRVVTYGSSMGGYGALAFNAMLRPDAVISMVPRASFKMHETAFDPRSRPERKGLVQWCGGIDPWTTRSGSEPETYIFYDPAYSLDRRHYDMIAAAIPTTPIPMPGSDHLVATFMREIGVLQEAVIAIIQGDFDKRALRRKVRELRMNSDQYKNTLQVRLTARADRVRSPEFS
ncbi:hypothetical protein AB4072_06890 [Microvirga sp. 2MCAF38]|uniref:hypothetical protein n=1 Tax=Microvirga sp. 2MCAF38 TaxID=3232989 RepID=UPI003F9CAC48